MTQGPDETFDPVAQDLMDLPALVTLSLTWPAERHKIFWRFRLDGYTVEIYPRTLDRLVVAFDSRMKKYPPSETRTAWAALFLARRGVAALHVKPDSSCWYRKPDIERFFRAAADAGLFSAFGTVMTYGGSMGGFGALSFAGLTGADRVLSLNPQTNLGPEVRSWETRYASAVTLDWAGPLCDLDAQVQGVETLAVVYDPYFMQDRKQVDRIAAPHAIRLHIPFVGHRIPAHLNDLKMLGDLFDETLAGEIDLMGFYGRARQRRTLLRYKRVMVATAKAQGTKRRRNRILRLLPDDADLIGDLSRPDQVSRPKTAAKQPRLSG